MKKINLINLKVLHDNVLIEPVEEESDDGVLRPVQYEDKAEIGVVVKVGPGRWLESGDLLNTTVKTGDLVQFNKYSPTKIKIEGKDYLYIREEDILSKQ